MLPVQIAAASLSDSGLGLFNEWHAAHRERAQHGRERRRAEDHQLGQRLHARRQRHLGEQQAHGEADAAQKPYNAQVLVRHAGGHAAHAAADGEPREAEDAEWLAQQQPGADADGGRGGGCAGVGGSAQLNGGVGEREERHDEEGAQRHQAADGALRDRLNLARSRLHRRFGGEAEGCEDAGDVSVDARAEEAVPERDATRRKDF
mmetsp:Transcript_15403/g.32815  ORF Transcript_15403/g.32815 Transcript_15403/m.32815 type:complete len:205 (+) Transcript_15403:557-1171(+)